MILRSCLGFGMLGACIGLVTAVISNPLDFMMVPIGSILGFLSGFSLGLIIIKLGKITEADLAKGLEYECPKCKHGIFETEPICEMCGYVLEL